MTRQTRITLGYYSLFTAQSKIKVRITKPLPNYKVGECVLISKEEYEKIKDKVEVYGNQYTKRV